MFGKKKGLVKSNKRNENNDFELQITALIDTLVIILIFMLKSGSSETLDIQTQQDLKMPGVNDGRSDGKGARISINKNGLFWNGELFVETVNYVAVSKETQNGGSAWVNLSNAIQATAKQEKEDNKFQGKVFLEADKNTPYPVLSAALKAARQNGYRDIRFVGIKYN